MSRVEAAVVVDAPVSKVWAIVADPRNLPQWDHHIASVEGVPPSGLAIGSTYRTWLRFMGVRAHTDAEVLELEPERYSKILLHGLIEATVQTWLEPLNGGRTRLRHVIDYRFIGGPIGRLAARGVKLLGAPAILRHGVAAQKRQAEGKDPGP